jgi:hypothetical protein
MSKMLGAGGAEISVVGGGIAAVQVAISIIVLGCSEVDKVDLHICN